MQLNNCLTDISGIKVGHAQNQEALTGCTVVLCEGGAVGGVAQYGGAPGTRETDLLRPMHLVQKIHAVILSGGSAFGLDTASGVMRYLKEKGIGFNTGVARIPIVPAAVIFDLSIGNPAIYPDAEMGYQACLNAIEKAPVEEGNVGVGCGATVGNIFGPSGAMKSGVGFASTEIGHGVIVAAMIVPNAFGDIIDPTTGKIIAGARSIQKGPLRLGSSDYFADTLQVMKSFTGEQILKFTQSKNTVLGVIATNAKLSKEGVNKVAQMAQDGLARTIRPAHTMLDGDTIFALATGKRKADINLVGAFAAEVTAKAILRAVRTAKPAGGLPCAPQND
jgi:L-aminopeptidase/D-esterase-like protein